MAFFLIRSCASPRNEDLRWFNFFGSSLVGVSLYCRNILSMKLFASLYLPLKEGNSILGNLIWFYLDENTNRSLLVSIALTLDESLWSSEKTLICWFSSRTSALYSQNFPISASRRSSGATSSIDQLFLLIDVKVFLTTAKGIRMPARLVTG